MGRPLIMGRLALYFPLRFVVCLLRNSAQIHCKHKSAAKTNFFKVNLSSHCSPVRGDPVNIVSSAFVTFYGERKNSLQPLLTLCHLTANLVLMLVKYNVNEENKNKIAT